jgi:hypothetical protein
MRRPGPSFLALLALLALPVLPGCASLLSSTTARMADNLSAATLDHPDPETVRQGAPAFLLIADGLIEGAPENTQLLLTGARLYGAYVSAFAEDPERARVLAERALGYARRALCTRDALLCAATDRPYDEFTPQLAELEPRDVDVLYVFATAWAGWAQSNTDDWNAIAQLPKIEACFERVLAIDDAHDGGNAHLYLGVMNTLRPASMGGRPEVGRAHFERAIELSQGRNLLAKVMFAQQYARLVFDRDLHDRLLEEVLAADPEAPGLTLSNVLAQQQALELLAGSPDFF